jgi:hypothetical protein
MVGPAPNPLYPDVPALPGVPPVFRDGSNPADPSPVDMLVHDTPGVAAGSRATWGIYAQGGNVALECDSVFELEPSREFRVSDFPLEKGGFQSYNKVATPAETRLTVTKGGSDVDRQAFLTALDQLVESVDIFDVITPDTTFLNRNLVRYSYHRSAERGATLLTVELVTIEVRETADVQFSNSKEPSGHEASHNGPVQAETPTKTQMPPPAPPSANPTVAAIPTLGANASQLDKARTVSAVIQAGGSINDLVTKNVGFQVVPLVPKAAQQLSVSLGGQRVALSTYQKAFGLFVDVYVNDALVIGGVAARNDDPIVRSAYLGFLGDLYFHDTQGVSDPTYGTLGTSHVLLYAGA